MRRPSAKTPQQAMDSLAAAQDAVLERLEKAGVQGDCGPKLNAEDDATRSGPRRPRRPATSLPRPSSTNEKPKGETIDYDTLIKSWPATPPKK